MSIQPTTGAYDADKRQINSGASVVICQGYAHASRRYDCSSTINAKHVHDHPTRVKVKYHGKPLKSQVESGEVTKKFFHMRKNRERTLVRAYTTTAVKINVGKMGLVLGRDKHLQSNWDVLIDGIVYAVSAKHLKVIDTPEDIADVTRRLLNKPELTV